MSGNAHFSRQHVSGSAGQNRQGHARVKHAVRNLVDCAVPARGNDEIASPLDLAPRLRRSGSRSLGRNESRLYSVARQQFGATLEQVQVARYPTRDRIVDDDRALRVEKSQFAIVGDAGAVLPDPVTMKRVLLCQTV